MKCKKAFTLIELLVVISIIALLLAILTPSLSNARRHAHKVVCKSNLKQSGIALHVYASSFNKNIPCYWRRLSNGKKEALASYGEWVGKDNTSDAQGLGMLKVNGYLDNYDVFFCPSDKLRRPFRDKQSGLAPLAPSSTNYEYVSYWYHYIPALGNTSGGTNMNQWSRYRIDRRTRKASNPAIVTDAGAWWTLWGGQVLYPVIHSDKLGIGWNILYMDGRVGWRRLNKFLTENWRGANWDVFLDYIDE